MTWIPLACRLNDSGRDRFASVIFQKARMPLAAMGGLSTEIALHQGMDFGFGLRQGQDVSPRIQLSLGVATDDLVLPQRDPLGVSLVYSGNTKIDPLQIG